MECSEVASQKQAGQTLLVGHILSAIQCEHESSNCDTSAGAEVWHWTKHSFLIYLL